MQGVPIDLPMSSIDLKQVPPVLLYYHSSTKTLAEKIIAIVKKKYLESDVN